MGLKPRFSFKAYCNVLEEVLLAQAKAARVLTHRGAIGTARELFVHEFLSKFLPDTVVVGRGEIVDQHGTRSNQQDVLLYRADFPVLTTLAHSHLYLAEGVLATIEVKSKLTKTMLTKAIENVGSVNALRPSGRGIIETSEQISGATMDLTNTIFQPNLPLASRLVFDQRFAPASEGIWTYVFAFDGDSVETTNNNLEATLANAPGGKPSCVCVLGKGVGFFEETPFSTPDALEVMAPRKQALSDFLPHLLWTVASRRRRIPVIEPLPERGSMADAIFSEPYELESDVD